MEFPCGICGDNVLETDEAVQCDGLCCLWHHRECLGMTLDEYLKLSKGQEDWFCRKCTVKQEIKQEAEVEQRRQLRRRSNMGKTKIECIKLEDLTGDQKCVFCNQTYIDEIKYGPIYMHKNIITHYYCLLLSSNMEQNGRDSDGILGFLANDIHKEVRRGVRLYCTYCKRGGATLGCAIARCKVVFHLPCGLKHGTMHQFFGEFKSYCAKHKPVQKISSKILSEASKNTMCGICYEKVVPRPIQETLWAPCCQKSAFFHRDCVQRLALSAGYFFKCPLCNNTNTFQQEMKDFGIYIPEQDASWECVPNAYQDLLVRHDTCDSASCSCPRGRKTNDQGTRWELILCKYCGSQGIHIGCGRLKWKSPEFVCDTCTGNTETQEEPNTRNYEGNRHRLSGTGRSPAILPPASAGRDEDDDSSDDDSSDESLKATITNRRGRSRVISHPQVETPPPPTKTYKIVEKHSRTSSPTSIVKAEGTVTYIIDDSDDDDVEVVGETKGGSCLKTIDGATIPIVKVQDHVKNRLNVYGDINVVTDEIVDITDQSEGPVLKKPPSPHVEEIIYEFPKPSTSTSVCPPSTSVPAPPLDVTKFVLVDPATFRPEDLPPGTVLYRSFTPMVQVPQSAPVQPQVQSVATTQVPMPQLGGANGGSADAEHPDLGEHRGWSDVRLRAPKVHSAKTSRKNKHHLSGRRGRGRCDNDRLNARVLVSPLKCRISDDGFFEILVPRRNLGFCFPSGSLKRKTLPLPSQPAKKIKKSSTGTVTERKNKSTKKKRSRKRKTPRKTKGESKTKTKSSKMKKGTEVSLSCETEQKRSLIDSMPSNNIPSSPVKTELTSNTLNHEKEKGNIPEKKAVKNKNTLLKWTQEKIDQHLAKYNSKHNQVHLNVYKKCEKSHEKEENLLTVKMIMDDLIGLAVKENLSKNMPPFNRNSCSEMSPDISSEVDIRAHSSNHSEVEHQQNTNSNNSQTGTSTDSSFNSSIDVSEESCKDMNYNKNEPIVKDKNDEVINPEKESTPKIFGLFPKLKLKFWENSKKEDGVQVKSHKKRKMNGNVNDNLLSKTKRKKIEKHSPVNHIGSIKKYFSPINRDSSSSVQVGGSMLPKNDDRPAAWKLQENNTFTLNILNSPVKNEISSTHASSEVKLSNIMVWRLHHSSPDKRPLTEIKLNETLHSNPSRAIQF